MIDMLNYDMVFYIMKFLPNHEIINFLLIKKKITTMFSVDKVVEFISYRPHPLVFTKNNTYCLFCNQGLIFLLNKKNDDFINCNHL